MTYEQIREYERQVEAEMKAETLLSDPVWQRFRLHYFVSNTKGKGKPRRWPKEVELIFDSNEPWKFVSWHKFPFDTKATEVVPFVDNPANELMKRIRKDCQ